MNENMEKIDKAKEDTYPERKDKYRGEPNFATIDKTPYRGYGFSEVIAYSFVAFQFRHGLYLNKYVPSCDRK